MTPSYDLIANTDGIFFHFYQKNAAFVHEAEWCKVAPPERRSTADLSTQPVASDANAVFNVYLFSGSNRLDQCTLLSSIMLVFCVNSLVHSLDSQLFIG